MNKLKYEKLTKSEYLRAKNLPPTQRSLPIAPDDSPRRFLVRFTPLPDQEISYIDSSRIEKVKQSHQSPVRIRHEEDEDRVSYDKQNLIHQIEVLESQLKQYREKYIQLQEDLQKAQESSGTGEKLKNQLNLLHKEKEQLIIERREYIERIIEIEEQLKDYNNENNVLRNKLILIEKENVDLEKEIENIRFVKLTLESQLEKLRIAYSDIEGQLADKFRRENLEESRKTVYTHQSKIDELQRNIYSLENINQELKAKLEKTYQEKIEINRNDFAISTYEERIRNLETISSEKDKDIQKMTNLIRELQFMSQDHKDKIHEKDVLIERLVSEVENINLCMKNMASDNQFYKKKCDILEKEAKNVNEMNQRLIESERVIQNLKVELQRCNNNDINGKIFEGERIIQQLKLELQRIYKEKEDLQIRLNDVLIKYSQIDNNQNRGEKAKKGGVQNLDKKNNNIINEIYDLSTQLEKIQLRGTPLRENSQQRILVDINEKDVEIKYKAKITSLETNILNLEVENTKLRQTIKSMDSQILNLNENLNQLQYKFDSVRKNQNKGYSGDIVSYMAEIEELKRQLIIFKENEIKYDAWKRDLDNKLQYLSAENDSKDQQINYISIEKQELYNEIINMRNEYSEKGIIRLTNEGDKLKRSLNMDQLIYENNELKNKVEFLETQNRNNQIEFNEKLQELNQKIEEVDHLKLKYQEIIGKIEFRQTLPESGNAYKELYYNNY